MADRGGGGNRPQRRTLGDYAYQQGPKHYNNIVIPPFNNKVMEPPPLSLIGSHPFAGMDHEDPYTHLSTFMELHSTMQILRSFTVVCVGWLVNIVVTGKKGFICIHKGGLVPDWLNHTIWATV